MEKQDHILPKGWVKTNIGQLANYINGRCFKKSEWKKAGLPIIRIQNLNNPNASYNYTDKIHEAKYHIRKDELLISWAASLDVYWWQNGDAWLNQHIFKVEPYEKAVDKKFLYFTLKGAIAELYKKTHGSGMVHITKGKFESHSVFLPPINEQKRIVNKIETLFSNLDKSEENLWISQKLLKSYRKAIIKSAVTGELTKDWRKKYNILDWNKLHLEDVILHKPRNGHSPKGVNYKTAVKNLTLTATTSGVFNPNYFKFVDIAVPKDSHLWLEEGDILIQRANSIDYVGVSAIYKGAMHEFIYPDLMMKVQPNKSLIRSEFLYFALSSYTTRKYFKSNATGTAGSMPKINQKVVMSAPILLPTLQEQDEIIDLVENVLFRISTLEAWCKAELKRSTTLRQTILKAAFSGKLVPQDNADEPARELLKRIQAERQATSKPKPTKNGRKSKKEAA